MPHPYKNIPDLLKQQPNWVVWGIHNAPPKAPFNPVSVLSGRPSPARAGIKDTWGSYHDAVDAVNCNVAQGIGYEFEGNDIYGIDLDKVIDRHGALTSEAYSIVNQLDSYTEISPSGKGLHIFVFAPEAQITRHRKKDHFLEIYNKGRYFTITGDTYGNNNAIETRSKELQSIHDAFLFSPVQRTAGGHSPLPVSCAHGDKFLNIGLERDKVFAALWDGERRHGNESSDDMALMNKLAYWCNANPDTVLQAFMSSPYFAQKDEAHIKKCQRSDYLPKTAANACSTSYSTAAADYERYTQRKRNMERSLAR
jgi:putative DNA primase/helicase